MRTPEPVHFAEMRALPAYELRARPRGVDVAMQVRQLPAPATPHLHRPRIVGAAVAGRLDVLDAWADAELRRDRIDRPGPGASVRIPETTALRLALMFRAVAPLRRVRDAHQVIAEADMNDPDGRRSDGAPLSFQRWGKSAESQALIHEYDAEQQRGRADFNRERWREWEARARKTEAAVGATRGRR